MSESDEPENIVYNVAVKYYAQIIHLIPVDDVLIGLIPKHIINIDDKQIIKSEKSDKRQAESLMDNYIMKKVESGEEDAFYILLEAMKESKKCDNLVREIYKDLGKPLPPDDTPVMANPKHNGTSFQDDDSAELISEVISNQRVLLTQKLSSDDLIDHLITARLIDDSVKQKLDLMCYTPMEKNRMIIDSLLRGPPGSVKKFCAILRKVKKYSFIADELEKERLQVIAQSCR